MVSHGKIQPILLLPAKSNKIMCSWKDILALKKKKIWEYIKVKLHFKNTSSALLGILT